MSRRGLRHSFPLNTVSDNSKISFDAWNETVLNRFDKNDGWNPRGDLIFDQAGNIYGTTYRGGGDNCGVIYELTPSGGGWEETVLYSAQGGAPCGVSTPSSGLSPKAMLHSAQRNGDGSDPVGGVVFDRSGNLYGVFEVDGPYGGGAVYELSPTGSGWTEQILYGFTGGSDGYSPLAGLTIDSAGNLYGSASAGGSGGCGTVFELTSGSGGWTFNTIYSFPGAPGGCSPQIKLTIDAAGNLYGTTRHGT